MIEPPLQVVPDAFLSPRQDFVERDREIEGLQVFKVQPNEAGAGGLALPAIVTSPSSKDAKTARGARRL